MLVNFAREQRCFEGAVREDWEARICAMHRRILGKGVKGPPNFAPNKFQDRLCLPPRHGAFRMQENILAAGRDYSAPQTL